MGILSVIDDCDYHKSIADKQRRSYNNSKLILDENSVFIELDWKQKVLIGMGPRQVSSEFREQQQRTLLGFGVYYKNGNNELKYVNIDLVSSNLSQKGLDSVNGFR